MATPAVALNTLALLTPEFPSGATTLSVDSSVLPLVINADTTCTTVTVLVGSSIVVLTNPVLVNGLNRFTGSIGITTQPTAQVFQITGSNNLSLQYSILYLDTELAVTIAPPSGVTIYRGSSTCRIEWVLPSFTGFEGVRVQWSTDPSGVSTPYQQYGGLVTEVARTGTVAISPTTTTVAANPFFGTTNQSSVVTTSTVIEAQINYCSATIPLTTVNQNIFYVTLTTVLQDPNTNAVYESLAAGPFTCGFVNLKVVNPIDFLALQKATDIATRLITELNRRDPDLDLTARSEIRDLMINPLSLELANMSVREWFSRCAQSVSALSQLDNATGNGISDPVTTSPVKQQIARAYGLGTTDVQTLINGRFDVLGEWAGITRGGSTTATVPVTFFVYARPLASIAIQVGVLVSSIPNSTTAAVQYTTTGSGSIDPANPAAYYDPTHGWWSVTVPAQCTVAGASGNVGAGSLNQVTSGGPSGVSCTNLTNATGGTDQQSNADYAAMIQYRLVTGVDTGSRNGYTVLTLEVPGITDALVVASGDTDMLRDWSSVIQRHTFGTVDIYARGGSQSQNTELVPFTYQTTSNYGSYPTYLTASVIDRQNLRFRITGFNALPFPLYSVVEMIAQSGGRTLWLGIQHARFDNVNGLVILDPAELAYVVNPDGSQTIWQINGANATNQQVIQSSGTTASVTYSLMARYQSGFSYVPVLQPVFTVNSLSGPQTGAIPAANLELFYTNDFLLTGGSNDAGDTVVVAATQTIPLSVPVVTAAIGIPVTIAQGMAVPMNSLGAPLNILSVRSSDSSILYEYGVDYTIVATAPYRTYGIQLLTGGSIVPGSTVLAGYNQYLLSEKITYQTDTLTLTGTTASSLLNPGFIRNSWLPASYGNTTLLLDGYSNSPQNGLVGAGTAPADRYIKVSFTNGLTQQLVTTNQGQDFQLSVNSLTGTATIARVAGGKIPDSTSVTVNYFTSEVFSLATEYPTYVQQAITAVDQFKHAAADVLVKAMVESPVDITMLVNLAPNVTPESIDGRIRTALGIALDNAQATAAQSVLVASVQALTGVTSIQLPLEKCAKSDGSYVIGSVLPTGTPWIPLAQDSAFQGLTALPANAYITVNPFLANQTIPSGGLPNAYVGLLYEGQSFTRCLSIQQFLAASGPSFYIIGTDDQIAASLPLNSTYAGKILIIVPATVANPALQPYRVTYQCFGNAGVSDITVASPEYLSPGNINILYSSASGS